MARWLIEHDTGVLPSQEDMHAAMAESGYVAKVVGGGKLYKAKLLGKSLRKPLCD